MLVQITDGDNVLPRAIARPTPHRGSEAVIHSSANAFLADIRYRAKGA